MTRVKASRPSQEDPNRHHADSTAGAKYRARRGLSPVPIGQWRHGDTDETGLDGGDPELYEGRRVGRFIGISHEGHELGSLGVRHQLGRLFWQFDDMTDPKAEGAAKATQSLRQRWLRVLAGAQDEELEQQASRHVLPAFEWLRPPEVGMVMLRARAGGTGLAFNLGEATVTRCTLRAGDTVGTGHVLGRDPRRAELVARLDAALQDPERHGVLMRTVVEPLEAAKRARRDARSQAAAQTKVEFMTLVRE